jgi:hypothetical protein
MWFSKEPVPEESGELGPPRRHPPTAVGVATPPPPPPPSRRSRERWVRLVPLPLLRTASIATVGIALGVFSIASLSALVPAPAAWVLIVAGLTLLAQLWVRATNAPVRSWQSGLWFRAYVPPR